MYYTIDVLTKWEKMNELFTEIIKALMRRKRHYIGRIASIFWLFPLNFESVLAQYPLSCKYSAMEKHVYVF